MAIGLAPGQRRKNGVKPQQVFRNHAADGNMAITSACGAARVRAVESDRSALRRGVRAAALARRVRSAAAIGLTGRKANRGVKRRVRLRSE